MWGLEVLAFGIIETPHMPLQLPFISVVLHLLIQHAVNRVVLWSVFIDKNLSICVLMAVQTPIIQRSTVLWHHTSIYLFLILRI